MKRKRESLYIENPFIKEENRTWSIHEPASLARAVSPPPTSARYRSTLTKSTAAQVEAGEKYVEDHFTFFTEKLRLATCADVLLQPKLDHQSWTNLYTTNATNPNGHHFVIHQHDHPVAGTHYDLRLQCNATSSVSWAIMYGLPGDPNSRRLNRNATETRIHCLWNHLIETASHQTGTLLIWDTGTYEVLPYREVLTQSTSMTTDEEGSEDERSTNPVNSDWTSLSEPEKLHSSFQSRRLRLRLHGTKLPKDYTILLWLRRENDRTDQPAAPKARRQKRPPSTSHPTLSRNPSSKPLYTTDSDSDSSPTDLAQSRRNVSSLHRHESPPTTTTPAQRDPSSHDDNEDVIRQTNAYPGATNSINSIHQRRWFLALDRPGSGFVKDDTGTWRARSEYSPSMHGSAREGRSKRDRKGGMRGGKVEPQGFPGFRVLGRDCERSVVTGRLAGDILDDEGVVGYVPRGKWRAVLE